MNNKIIILAFMFGIVGIAMAAANQENIISFKLFTWNTTDNPESINESITFKAGSNINFNVDKINKTLEINSVGGTQSNTFDTLYVNEINPNTTTDIKINSSIKLSENKTKYKIYIDKYNYYIGFNNASHSIEIENFKSGKGESKMYFYPDYFLFRTDDLEYINRTIYYSNPNRISLRVESEGIEINNLTVSRDNIITLKPFKDLKATKVYTPYIYNKTVYIYTDNTLSLDSYNPDTYDEVYIDLKTDDLGKEYIELYVYDDWEGSDSRMTFYYDHADYNSEFDTQQLKIKSLSGTGNAYACLDSQGKLFRSVSPCV